MPYDPRRPESSKSSLRFNQVFTGYLDLKDVPVIWGVEPFLCWHGLFLAEHPSCKGHGNDWAMMMLIRSYKRFRLKKHAKSIDKLQVHSCYTSPLRKKVKWQWKINQHRNRNLYEILVRCSNTHYHAKEMKKLYQIVLYISISLRSCQLHTLVSTQKK